MAYFSNGVQEFRKRYCANCVHETCQEQGCPVLLLFTRWNEKQKEDSELAWGLSQLIEQVAPGHKRCKMFYG